MATSLLQSLADSPPSDLCIVRLSAIGDTCHTVPVVRAIQDAWPQTRITWIIGRIEHTLLEGLEGVEFAVLDKGRGWRGYADLHAQLKGRHFPVLLHMHGSMRANIASRLAASDVRVGFDRDRAKDFQWYFCDHHIAPTPYAHVMDSLFEFAAALGIERGEPRWDMPLGAADRQFAANAIDGTRPTLVISPCSGQRFRNYRNWRVERYAEVADYAATRFGADVVLTGGPTPVEHTYARGIVDLAQCSPRNLVGKTTLKQLLAVLERASVVLCPDSGPAHMATSVRTPVVGLYATTNRVRAGPYFSQHLVVDKYPEAVRMEFRRDVEEIRWARRVRNPEAMNLIRPADVFEKLEMAFAERSVKPLSSVAGPV